MLHLTALRCTDTSTFYCPRRGNVGEPPTLFRPAENQPTHPQPSTHVKPGGLGPRDSADRLRNWEKPTGREWERVLWVKAPSQPGPIPWLPADVLNRVRGVPKWVSSGRAGKGLVLTCSGSSAAHPRCAAGSASHVRATQSQWVANNRVPLLVPVALLGFTTPLGPDIMKAPRAWIKSRLQPWHGSLPPAPLLFGGRPLARL
jgi:hypothetical protein